MAFKIRNALEGNDPYLQSKTAVQWRKEQRVPNADAEGQYMHHNGFRQGGSLYFLPEDTHAATAEEMEQWRLERREKDQARRQRQQKKREREEAYQAYLAEQERKRAEDRQALLHACRSTDKARIVCLDVETTGLQPGCDEILQLSIVDGTGRVLFNEYIRPKTVVEWPEAEAVNGIAPAMVADKPTIDAYIPRISAIMEEADLIVGYNSIGFDLPFLRHAGIVIPEQTRRFDVMLEFAPVYGEWDERHQDYIWQRLSTCASFYGYESEGRFHDSLEDVRATLHCFFAMLEE